MYINAVTRTLFFSDFFQLIYIINHIFFVSNERYDTHTLDPGDGINFTIAIDKITNQIFVQKNSIIRAHYRDPKKESGKNKVDFQVKCENFNVPYDEIKINIRGPTIFINLGAALACLVHSSKHSGEDLLSSRIYCLINYLDEKESNLDSTFKNLREIFFNFDCADQIKFIDVIFNHARKKNTALFNHLSKLGSRGTYESHAITPESKRKKFKKQILASITTIKEIFLGKDHENLFISPIKTSHINEIELMHENIEILNQQILKAYKYEEELIKGFRGLINNMRSLYVDILKEKEMLDIVRGVILNGENLEENMRESFTIIKKTLNISDLFWDEFFYPNLEHLNNLLGLRLIWKSKVYRKNFHKMTELYDIKGIEGNGTFGSIFSFRSSVERDLENPEFRKLIDWKAINGQRVINNCIWGDAATKPGREHVHISTIQRMIMDVAYAAQNPYQQRADVHWIGGDDHQHQKIFAKPYYDEIGEVEDSFFDPLTQDKIQAITWLACDLKYLRDAWGIKSETSSLGHPLCDEVTYADIINPENRPLNVIFGGNKDKGGNNKNYERIVSKLSVNTPDARQNLSNKMKISTRDEHIGFCSLFCMVLMHSHFKIATRFIVYLAMLLCIILNLSLNGVMVLIGSFCGISIIFLHTSSKSTKPGCSLRGDDCNKILNCMENFIKEHLPVGIHPCITQTTQKGLIQMVKSGKIVSDLMYETNDLEREEIIQNSNIFSHHITIFVELGMSIFEREFLTWTLCMLIAQGPCWYVICHTVALGWWNFSENGSEAGHKLALRSYMSNPVVLLESMDPTVITTNMLKFKRLIQDINDKYGYMHSISKAYENSRKKIEKKSNNSTDELQDENDVMSLEENEVQNMDESSESEEDEDASEDSLQIMNSESESESCDDLPQNEEEIQFNSRFTFQEITNKILFTSTGGNTINPMSTGFKNCEIIIPGGNRSKILIEMEDEDGMVWQIKVPWWILNQIKIVEGGEKFESNGQMKDINRNRKINTISPRNGCKILIFDLLVAPKFQSKSRNHTNSDPSSGYLSNCNSIFVEVKSNSNLEEFMERIEYQCEKRGLDLLDQNEEIIFDFMKDKFTQRMNQRNKSHLRLIDNLEEVEREINFILDNYLEVGSINNRHCFHERCREVIGEQYTHGYCKNYVNDPEIKCDCKKHDLWFQILEGRMESCDDAIYDNELVYPDLVVEVAKNISKHMFTLNYGLDLLNFKAFINQLEIDLDFNLLFSCLSTKLVIHYEAKRVYHRRYLRFIDISKETFISDREKLLNIFITDIID